jgi:hypothetical protein
VIRRILATAAVAIMATACLGAAATLALSSDQVAAGSASPDVDCSTGTQVTYGYTGNDVTSVAVSNLPAACQTGRIWLTLLDASTPAQVKLQAGPVSFTGSSVTFQNVNVPAVDVKQYRIAVVR